MNIGCAMPQITGDKRIVKMWYCIMKQIAYKLMANDFLINLYVNVYDNSVDFLLLFWKGNN